MSRLGQQLKEFRIRKGLSQRQLSLAVGIEQATISRIENGTMPLVSPHLERLADYLGAEILNPLGSNVAPVALQGRIVPLWPQSVAAREFAKDRENGPEAEQHMMTAKNHSTSSFAMSIEDDSMLPRFNRGHIVIVDPAVTPNAGSFVVASRGRDEAAVLGRYAARGTDSGGNPVFELLPLNAVYQSLHSANDHLRVLGVVVEKIELDF